LLANGQMCMPVYSSRRPEDVARASYRSMTEAAELMGLLLSEPVMEITGSADCWGGRIVTVRAGVFDAIRADYQEDTRAVYSDHPDYRQEWAPHG
jgi:hypothetical protein